MAEEVKRSMRSIVRIASILVMIKNQGGPILILKHSKGNLNEYIEKRAAQLGKEAQNDKSYCSA
ncbi:MAG: hypothetical protein AB8V46_01845 [Candidatus Midichloria sp.]